MVLKIWAVINLTIPWGECKGYPNILDKLKFKPTGTTPRELWVSNSPNAPYLKAKWKYQSRNSISNRPRGNKTGRHKIEMNYSQCVYAGFLAKRLREWMLVVVFIWQIPMFRDFFYAESWLQVKNSLASRPKEKHRKEGCCFWTVIMIKWEFDITRNLPNHKPQLFFNSGIHLHQKYGQEGHENILLSGKRKRKQMIISLGRVY